VEKDDFVVAPEIAERLRWRKGPACEILDAADAALYILGPEALPLYKSAIQLYETLMHSGEEEHCRYLFKREYVWKAEAMWADLRRRMGVIPEKQYQPLVIGPRRLEYGV